MTLTRGAIDWKRWRKSAGLTQSEAAAKLDCDPFYLAKIEQGRRKPGRSLASRMDDLSDGDVSVASWDLAPRAVRRPSARVKASA